MFRRLEQKTRHKLQKSHVKVQLDGARDQARDALASAETNNNTMTARMARITTTQAAFSTAVQQLQAPAAQQALGLAAQSSAVLTDQALVARLGVLQTTINAQCDSVRHQRGLVSSIPDQIEIEGENHLNRHQAEERGQAAAGQARAGAQNINAALVAAQADLQTIDAALNDLKARLGEAREAQRQHDAEEALRLERERMEAELRRTNPELTAAQIRRRALEAQLARLDAEEALAQQQPEAVPPVVAPAPQPITILSSNGVTQGLAPAPAPTAVPFNARALRQARQQKGSAVAPAPLSSSSSSASTTVVGNSSSFLRAISQGETQNGTPLSALRELLDQLNNDDLSKLTRITLQSDGRLGIGFSEPDNEYDQRLLNAIEVCGFILEHGEPMSSETKAYVIREGAQINARYLTLPAFRELAGLETAPAPAPASLAQISGSNPDPLILSGALDPAQGRALMSLRNLLVQLNDNFQNLTYISLERNGLVIGFSDQESRTDIRLQTAIEACGFRLEGTSSLMSHNATYKITVLPNGVNPENMEPSAFRVLAGLPTQPTRALQVTL